MFLARQYIRERSMRLAFVRLEEQGRMKHPNKVKEKFVE